MSIEQIRQEAQKLTNDIGKAALSAKFPNDFEYYLMSFDLKSDGKEIASLIFPVNPEQIRYTKQTNTTIKKTMSGVNVVINPTFNPFPIAMSGTFGRGFKTLLIPDSGKIMNLQGALLTQRLIPNFSLGIKNGYGCFKLLEKMCSLCNQIDPNTKKPYVLQFNDLSCNESYYVEIKSFSFDMNVQKNMMWYYSINMVAVAETRISSKKRIKMMGNKIVSSVVNKVGSNLAAKVLGDKKTTNLFN